MSIEKAILTYSIKTDTRNTQTRMFDNFLEFQDRNDKEPRAQFFGSIYSQNIKGFGDPLSGLIQDSKGFYIINYTDPNYQAPNAIPYWFSTQSLNALDIGFNDLYKIKIVANINWFSRSTSSTFGADFSFDLILTIAEVNNANPQNVTPTDYLPFIQLKIAKVNYTLSSGTFTYITTKRVIDLTDITVIQDFTGGQEVSQIMTNQLDKLKNGNMRLSYMIGFDTAALTPAIKTAMYQQGIFIDTSQLDISYFGTNKL